MGNKQKKILQVSHSNPRWHDLLEFDDLFSLDLPRAARLCCSICAVRGGPAAAAAAAAAQSTAATAASVAGTPGKKRDAVSIFKLIF